MPSRREAFEITAKPYRLLAFTRAESWSERLEKEKKHTQTTRSNVGGNQNWGTTCFEFPKDPITLAPKESRLDSKRAR